MSARPPGPGLRAERDVYTVSRLNREVRMLLDHGMPVIWVEAEISNFSRPASGHWYFTLKDRDAQVRCAMFRQRNAAVRFTPAEGKLVLARARVGLYEPRGDYQLIVDHLEAAGEGLLRRRLEELKQKLAAAGLFDPGRKRPLPALPRAIGVITSPSGAAVRDIVHVLRRRFPAIPVIIYPVQVQGEQAKFDIVKAFGTAARRAECEVLILARGGGSLEDLWAFNEEIVAQAIADCPIPVVSGVGHEIDFTIADLVADVRAPTPSGAAELVVPDSRDWLRHLQALERRTVLAATRTLANTQSHQQQLAARLARCHPGYQLRQHAQRLDELRHQLTAALANRLALDALRIDNALHRLQRVSPVMQLRLSAERVAGARQRLAAAIRVSVSAAGSQLAVLSGRLQTVSPLSTLERGYALVLDAGGSVVRSTAQLKAGDTITARLADGVIGATVNRTK